MAEQPESKSKSISDKLAAKLEKRPNPQQVGYNMNLSPTLASVVKKLETEQKKDIVDKILKNRPAPTEAGVNTTIAPSIQPTVKTLTNKIRRDSLKQSLQARPDMQELIDSGVLKPYSINLANSLQVDAAKLESALASQVSKEYLREIGVLDPYKKNVDDTKIDIEKSSGLLLRALVYRRSYNSILKEGGSGTQFGFINNIAPCIQDKAKHLDIQQKKDKLSAALQTRPSPRGVMNKQVEQLGYDISVASTLQQTIKNLGKEMIKDTLNALFKNNIKEKNINRKRASSIESFDVEKLAPTLQLIANKLAMEQKKNTLSAQLNSRSDAQELIDKRILKPYAYSLANRLQLNADLLEKQLAMRVDENYLKQIGILEPYKKNVDDTKIDIEQASNLILKSLIIKQKKERKDNNTGNVNNVAPSLQAIAKKLEHEKTKDLLKKKLERNRPNRKDIRDIDDSVANSLQATKKKLEKEMVKDTINKTLSTRQEPEITKIMKISPAIQSIAIALQSKMRRQSISEKLQARPDMQELIDTGILKPYSINLAKSLQVDANQLEQALAQRVSKEYLKQIGILDPYKKNVDDTKIDIEKASGLLLRALVKNKNPINLIIKQQTSAFGFNNDIAPTLQQTAKNLDVQQKKDKLSAALENRPTPRGLMEKQVSQLGYDISVAPTLQQTIKNLGREMLKDLLEKALRERPDAKHVGHGVDIKNAPAIQGAMHKLQSAQRRDSVSKGIRDRKSVKEVGVDTQLARGLQSIAKTLQMEMKTDTVKHKLGNLGIIKKINTESVLVKIDQCVQFLANYKF